MDFCPKLPRSRKLISIIGTILFLTVSIIIWRYGNFATWNLERSSVSVEQVLDNYEEYEGKRIVLRGYGTLAVSQTLVECMPDYCGCNTSLGEFYIGDILVEEVECSGDQCDLFCTPFHPEDGSQYLIIGIIVIRSDEYQGGQPKLSLTEVDFEKSGKMLFGRWVSIK